MSKETYYSVKRDLYQCQKRPTTVSKETYISVKRDLYQCQKRPISVSKETYISVKRDLYQCQKRPISHHNGACSHPNGRHKDATSLRRNQCQKKGTGKRDLILKQKRPEGGRLAKEDGLCRKKINKKETKRDLREAVWPRNIVSVEPGPMMP